MLLKPLGRLRFSPVYEQLPQTCLKITGFAQETFTGHLREWQLSLKSLYFKNQAVKVNNQALKEEVERSQETTAKTTNETEELRRQFEESSGANGNLRIRLEGADTQL